MSALAWTVLGVHLVIIAFNVGGMALIPIGAWRRWQWVRGFAWRLAHVVALAAVAVQALFGRACFLTIWQADLHGTGAAQPLIAGWINRVIYWPLPLWFFAAVYSAAWLYVLLLWWRIPPRLPWHDSRGGRTSDA